MATRTISASGQFVALFRAQLERTVKTKKTLALLGVHLVPVVAALVYTWTQGTDGSTLFRQIVGQLTYPYLIPLTALFYGGPAIVEEIEGRTLTYLTLRPISRPLLYVGKVAAVTCVALAMVLGPMGVLWGVSLAGGGEMGATVGSLVEMLGGAAMGTAIFCAIFAALGAFFTTSMVASIIYIVVFELSLAVLPMVEMLSVRYYVRAMGGLEASSRLEFLDKIILAKPIVVPQWAAYVLGLAILGAALGAGASIFRTKQYHV